MYNNYINNNMIIDYGLQPYVVDLEETTNINNNYRTTLWTGNKLQLTVMSIPINSDIGLENHPNVEQFIRIESGNGLVQMGIDKNNLIYQVPVSSGYAVIIPSGIWHNIINIGNTPLKLYSIYAPPNHLKGTINITKENDFIN